MGNNPSVGSAGMGASGLSSTKNIDEEKRSKMKGFYEGLMKNSTRN